MSRIHGAARSVALTLALLLAGCASQPAPESAPSPPVVSSKVLAALALPVYPNAQPVQGGGAIVKTARGTIAAAYYRSADTLDAVEKFYARKLPKGSLRDYIPANGSGAANFVFVSDGARRQVTLSTDDAGTIIGLTATRPLK